MEVAAEDFYKMPLTWLIIKAFHTNTTSHIKQRKAIKACVATHKEM